MRGPFDTGLISSLLIAGYFKTLPYVLATVTYLVVYIGFRRSSRLQNEYPILFRTEIVANIIFGALLCVLVEYIPLITPIKALSSVHMQRALLFLSTLSLNTIVPSLALGAICRYLSARQPQSHFLAALSRKRVNIVLGLVIILSTLPCLFIIRVNEFTLFEETISVPYIAPWAFGLRVFYKICYCILTLVYYGSLHLLTWRFNPEAQNQTAQSPRCNGLLLSGAGYMKNFIHLYIICMLPIMILLLCYESSENMFDFAEAALSMLYSLVCFVDPICFALKDKTIRDECRRCLHFKKPPSQPGQESINSNGTTSATTGRV